MTEHTETLIELNGKLERLLNGIDTLGANQERMCEDISKIKEAMYNPDAGLYARLKLVEEQRKNAGRLTWFIFTVLVGSLAAALGKLLSSG